MLSHFNTLEEARAHALKESVRQSALDRYVTLSHQCRLADTQATTETWLTKATSTSCDSDLRRKKLCLHCETHCIEVCHA